MTASIKDKLLAYLMENPEESYRPQHLAKAVGKQTAKDVNAYLYALEKEGLIEKVFDKPPQWKAINPASMPLKADLLRPVEMTDCSEELTVPSKSSTSDEACSHASLKHGLLQVLQEDPNKSKSTLDLAKAVGLKRAKDVNKQLHELEKEGLLKKTKSQPPQWSLLDQSNSYSEQFLLNNDDGGANKNSSHGNHYQMAEKRRFKNVEMTDYDVPDGESNELTATKDVYNDLEFKMEDLCIRDDAYTEGHLDDFLFGQHYNVFLKNVWPWPLLLANLHIHLTSEESSMLRNIQGLNERCDCLLNLLKNKPQLTKEDFCCALKKSGQEYLANFIKNPGGPDIPMSDGHRRVLHNNATIFLEDMVLDEDLWSHLIEDDIITDEMKEYVEKKGERSSQITELLFVLERCGDKAFSSLKKALEMTSQLNTARLCFDSSETKQKQIN